LPILYNIDETWIQLNPKPAITTLPQEIKPLTKLSWKYLAPKSLATSGIYSQQDLEELRDHIMFPAEKGAVLHTIARDFTKQSIPSDAISLQNLLDEDSLNKIYIVSQNYPEIRI
jgi:chromosome condensin MukBEF MukE localization factor